MYVLQIIELPVIAKLPVGDKAEINMQSHKAALSLRISFHFSFDFSEISWANSIFLFDLVKNSALFIISFSLFLIPPTLHFHSY